MPKYIVIGGGIIGSAVALELARKNAGEITVLEKESALGCHASGRNSGVIHSGINQKPGTLKAKMCVDGSRRLREFCRANHVPMVECGTLVVARDKRELATLERLLLMGQQCGVPGLTLLNDRELKSREPNARGFAALFSPTGATVHSLRLLEAVAQAAKDSGVIYRLNHRVIGIEAHEVITSGGVVAADHIVNCAGLEADRIAHMMGAGKAYRIIPFRGEYMEVAHCEVRTMIYQPPDLRFPFLSIHLTRETDGKVLAGPSAVLAFGREAYNKECDWRELWEMVRSRQFLRLVTSPAFLGLVCRNAKTSLFKKEFLKEAQRLASSVKAESIRPYRAGIRAQLVDTEGHFVNDLLVEKKDHSTHILNAVSPGMTCSLSFAESVVSSILN